jgi:outer membrane protein OmpA-like peptidoglycan-associated protein
MNRRGRATISGVVGLLLLLLGCAGQDLAVRANGVRDGVRKARDNGAYRCAPRPLALSEANLEFAERELDRGEYFGALDHIEIAEVNVREALRLSPAGGCGKPLPVPPPAPASPVDTDGDGIPDVSDLCPTVPEDKDGFQDEDGCPDLDNDQDGIPDTLDKCPNEPEDKDGFEDEDGCPDLDNDQDGIPDAEDLCPNEPGPPEEKGCPKKPTLVSVTQEKIEIHQAVFFATGKATIMPQSFALLNEVADVLKTRATMQVRVEGHTDTRGSRTTNLRLSQARAESVKAYIVGRGIDASRLVPVGYGPDKPIETNKTAAGRERNRRVEFMILQQ